MSNLIRLFISLFLLALSPNLGFAASSLFDDTPIVPEYIKNERPTSAPSQRNYLLLQIELGRYEIASQRPWPILPEYKHLRVGKKSDAIFLLRERLRLTGDLQKTDGDPYLCDEDLIDAVKLFQQRHGLNADGVIGPLTLGQLNLPPEERIREIKLNIARWVALSRELGNRYIMVNIPDYQLYLIEDGKEVLTMKAIVGKPEWPTPELSSRITRLVLNPAWNVPDKIAARDLAPKVRNDPYYLYDMHIKVFIRNTSREVDHSRIDWADVGDEDSRYDFRQDPGDDNALGLVKFEFPNTYSVYLHDTPVKELFDKPDRDLSHGCVRLERPFDLVAYLMKDDPHWDEMRMQQILDTRETTYVKVAKPMPIFITYITVWTDENGVVNYRNDIYQHDL